MQDVVIVGAGSHARGIKSILDELNKLDTIDRYNFIGYLDDDYKNIGYSDVIGPVDTNLPGTVRSIIAINNSRIREEVDRRVVVSSMSAIIHPTAFIGEGCKLSPGVVIQAGVILTCNVMLYRGVHINVGSTISQGTVIKKFSTISPGVHIAGEVSVGERVQIGTGVSIINRINIGDEIVIGAGAVVVHDVVHPGTYIGTPARLISEI